MPKVAKNTNRNAVRSVSERGCSRRHDTAENHRVAVQHYRDRAIGRENKAPKK